jgi:hypothetical protein
MSWDSIVDTLLNIGTFVVIGLLVWLYFKKVPGDAPPQKPEVSRPGESDRD